MSRSILISGASIAGLATAYWMNRLGYQVTIVEIASEPRTGGAPVDIRGVSLEVVQRMGILEQLKSQQLFTQYVAFKNDKDETQCIMQSSNADIEIEQSKLLRILYESSDKNIEFLFSNSITTIEDHTNHVSVSFQDGSRRKFDLLIGCDGIHSIVRKLIWGEEALFTHFLGAYFCILHFNTPLIKSDTVEMYNMPGKMSAIYCYGNNTDVMLAFLSEKISYDFRDVAAQKKIILRHFSGEGWRVPELLAAMEKTEVFYFDELCQVKMPNWSKGRVVLVGDAGYCATFATGMGTTLSLAGAATLADSLQKAGDDYKKAFEEYNTILQPFAEQTQAGVYEGLAFLIPKTGEEILTRNSRMKV